MTDKVQKIKEWISKEQDGLMDANGNFDYPEHDGAYNILCNLDAYIDSLQEESVSEDEIEKQFKVGDVVVYVSRQPAYSGFYILGNANDLSIGYSNYNEPFQIALRNCTIASEAEYSQFFRELNLNGYKWNNDTLRIEKIEPVSEDLIVATNNYCVNARKGYPRVMDETDRYICNAFKAGAKWQKDRIMLNTIDATCFGFQGAALFSFRLPAGSYLVGSKVKVIIIKED